MAYGASVTTLPLPAVKTYLPDHGCRRGATRPLRWPGPVAAPARRGLDVESRAWWERLHAAEPVRGWAVAELHDRLRREAALHVRARVRALPDFPRSDIDDLAVQAADDALLVLLRKLDDYRGDSQFWTWARRFAALEALGTIRRRGRDRVGILRDPDVLHDVADRGCSVHERAELGQSLRAVIDRIADALTPHQRTVLMAVAVDGVLPKALAAELETTPGAVYKTLYDARRKLRALVEL
jgi:RNA polymerase sigma-70 factor, ECF subfamily